MRQALHTKLLCFFITLCLGNVLTASPKANMSPVFTFTSECLKCNSKVLSLGHLCPDLQTNLSGH